MAEFGSVEEVIMTIETAVVLAGGAGLRMRPLTDDRPKIMVEVGDRPLLDWILAWLKANDQAKLHSLPPQCG